MLSNNGKQLVKDFEQCVLKAYMAPEQVELFNKSGKKEFTIGWGATYIPAGLTLSINKETISFNKNTPITEKMILDSEAEADKLFDAMIPIYATPLEVLVKVPLNQDQYDSLFSFIYNIGQAGFASSTLLKELNKGNYAGAAAQIARWDNIGQNESKGLENRRVKEIELFCSSLNKNNKNNKTKLFGIF